MKRGEVVDGVQEIVLDDWLEFLSLVTTSFRTAPYFAFRGQANYQWPLIPGLTRLEQRYPNRLNLSGTNPKHFPGPPLSEDEQIAAFKRAIVGRRGVNPPPLSDEEYWALGQHHGLATRLLDVTRSPFVALYFAFAEERVVIDESYIAPEFRGVFAISCRGVDESDYGLSLVSVESDSNYRAVSQSAALIRVMEQRDVESCVRQKWAGHAFDATFMKIKVPNHDRNGCLIALNKMNINSMTMFPDLNGAAEYVNSLWQPGHEDLISNEAEISGFPTGEGPAFIS